MLSGEYAVLDGALALALPCRLGQQLEVTPSEDTLSHWIALDHEGSPWLQIAFDQKTLHIHRSSDSAAAQMIMDILAACRAYGSMEPAESPLRFTTRLEFDRSWGLGSSSSLLSLMAQWSGADPYALLKASFGGSGYDLACATAGGPIFYQLRDGSPGWVDLPLCPDFANAIYFIYLGQKQNSREGIARYRAAAGADRSFINEVSRLSWQMAAAPDLEAWSAAMDAHEELIGQIINLPMVRDLYFEDYWGSVKSLGAWGGDFVMATSEREAAETRAYFERAGFRDIFSMTQLGLLP